MLENKLLEIQALLELDVKTVIDLTDDSIAQRFSEGVDLSELYPDLYFKLGAISIIGDQKATPELALLDLLREAKNIKSKGFDTIAWRMKPTIEEGIDVPENRKYFTGRAELSVGFGALYEEEETESKE